MRALFASLVIVGAFLGSGCHDSRREQEELAREWQQFNQREQERLAKLMRGLEEDAVRQERLHRALQDQRMLEERTRPRFD